jgi:hypothetical protein
MRLEIRRPRDRGVRERVPSRARAASASSSLVRCDAVSPIDHWCTCITSLSLSPHRSEEAYQVAPAGRYPDEAVEIMLSNRRGPRCARASRSCQADVGYAASERGASQRLVAASRSTSMTKREAETRRAAVSIMNGLSFLSGQRTSRAAVLKIGCDVQAAILSWRLVPCQPGAGAASTL